MCARKVLLLSVTTEFRVSMFSQDAAIMLVDKKMRKHSAAEGQSTQHAENQYANMTKGEEEMLVIKKMLHCRYLSLKILNIKLQVKPTSQQSIILYFDENENIKKVR